MRVTILALVVMCGCQRPVVHPKRVIIVNDDACAERAHKFREQCMAIDTIESMAYMLQECTKVYEQDLARCSESQQEAGR